MFSALISMSFSGFPRERPLLCDVSGRSDNRIAHHHFKKNSKPTHLKYFRASQRKSPSESEDFPVLIQPNFLNDFLSESVQE
jgi:hypothetical protein